MKPPSADIPLKLRPFITLGFDYHENRVAGEEAFGDCPLCGGKGKFYVNVKTGQWDCKAGSCGLRGNLYTFVKEWYEDRFEEQNLPQMANSWKALSTDRKLTVDQLMDAGIVYDGEAWYIPVRNPAGNVINLRRYTIGGGLRGLAEIDTQIFGQEILSQDKRLKEPVFLCEGEWDAIALRIFLEREKKEGVVIGAPGAGLWKDAWTDPLVARDIIICYDHDSAGVKGKQRVWQKIYKKVKEIRHLNWPDQLPEGFDVRDFVTRDGTWEEFLELMLPYVSDEKRNSLNEERVSGADMPPLMNPNRPSFHQVVEMFSQHLHMSSDMKVALRVIFAVVLSNQIKGDPLWLHVVSPPGTAKTELLMPLSGCASCYFASTLTSHSLVSGFVAQGGTDPSLLPKLDGKTFVLKDWTEILNMPKVEKDQIYGTLRGAYDGSVEKLFGNGLNRSYKVRFNMISGVTHSVFGERSASLGERFLLFHLVKGVGFSAKDSIRAAIRNVGKEGSVRVELQDIVRSFVEVKVNPDEVPAMPEWMEDRIIALSSIVAILRATVEKTYNTGSEKILYRPQHEMGTRLAKQLSKLAYGLSLVNNPPALDEPEYEIVCRVALDTCVGFNLECIGHLVEHGGTAIEDLCNALSLPMSTLRDQLDDMAMLGAIRKEKIPNPFGRGAPFYIYHASDLIRAYWIEAGLVKSPVVEALPDTREITRTIKRVRRRKARDPKVEAQPDAE